MTTTRKKADMELSFEEWMKAVDRQAIRKAGISIHDLADQPFRDLFEDGLDPAEVVADILEDEGWGE
jgi:hypothetical protein